MPITSGHLGTFHMHTQHFSWMWYSAVNYSCLYLWTNGHFHYREALHPLISTSPAFYSDLQCLQSVVSFMLLKILTAETNIRFHVLVKLHSTWLSLPGIFLLNRMPSGFIHNVNQKISPLLFTCFVFFIHTSLKKVHVILHIDACEIWCQNCASVIT